MNKVKKPFNVEGINRIQGEIITIGRVRNQKVLLDQRYISEHSGGYVSCSHCDRIFENDAVLEHHTKISHPEKLQISKEVL